MTQGFAVEPRTHRGMTTGVEGETDLPGFAVVDDGGEEVEWFFEAAQESAHKLADRLNAQDETVACVTCGNIVTAIDPVKFPYCKNCFYTGRAFEHLRADQLTPFREAFPEAGIAVEHTGGGCFWLAVTFPDDDVFYALTDGEACLPSVERTGEAETPIRDGWGYVGRYAATYGEDDGHPDADGTTISAPAYGDNPGGSGVDPSLYWDEYPKHCLTDERVIEIIRKDREGRKAWIVFYDAENTYYAEGTRAEAIAEAESVMGAGWKHVHSTPKVVAS